MRWMAWNCAGCILWLAGLAYAKGISLVGEFGTAGDGHHLVAGLSVGLVGLFLLTWVNLIDAS